MAHRAHSRSYTSTLHSSHDLIYVPISNDFRMNLKVPGLAHSVSVSALNYIETSLRNVLLLPYITLCSDESILYKRVKKGEKALYGQERR